MTIDMDRWKLMESFFWHHTLAHNHVNTWSCICKYIITQVYHVSYHIRVMEVLYGYLIMEEEEIKVRWQLRYSSFLTSCSRAPNRKWMPVFLMHSIKIRVFYHSSHMFKFVFDCHRFTHVRLSSNSSGMHCKYMPLVGCLYC